MSQAIRVLRRKRRQAPLNGTAANWLAMEPAGMIYDGSFTNVTVSLLTRQWTADLERIRVAWGIWAWSLRTGQRVFINPRPDPAPLPTLADGVSGLDITLSFDDELDGGQAWGIVVPLTNPGIAGNGGALPNAAQGQFVGGPYLMVGDYGF